MEEERAHDFLQDRHLEEDEVSGETWQVIYMCVVLLYMLIALLSDRVGADAVMVTALTLCMAAELITIKEGLEGFANEGVLTVMVLFMVAHGISVTGALDWYMGKLLGRPKTVAGAQVRLMIPIAIASAFLNNTPIVAVMIPIVLRWGKNVRVAPQQLLMPLSFATILGGTCTLIGTSTNLVVSGLIEKRYPNDESLQIGLFDLGEYGVPVALVGIAYILFAAPFFLPGAVGSNGGDHRSTPLDNGEDILLGARLTQWSPAAGRSVKRSGLRDTGGIYLVSVCRAATGNIHRAVGQEFILNVGDLLYFTGLVEGFGDFCDEHGLEVITNEVDLEETLSKAPTEITALLNDGPSTTAEITPASISIKDEEHLTDVSADTGTNNDPRIESDEIEQLQRINRMSDLIRGQRPNIAKDKIVVSPNRLIPTVLETLAPPEIVVTTDHRDTQRLVLVGINVPDRPGLLLDISKGLLRLNLELHHSEAAVVQGRSLSVWWCEFVGDKVPDVNGIWTVLSALLESQNGVQAVKKRGLKVVRATVTKQSRLVGQVVGETNFRNVYKAAIVAVQQEGKNATQTLSTLTLGAGDILVLQASDDSPLLSSPPEDFYKTMASPARRPSSGKSIGGFLSKRFSTSDGVTANRNGISDPADVEMGNTRDPDIAQVDAPDCEAVWSDLVVLATQEGRREFLVAMQLTRNSGLADSTVEDAGLTKFPGVVLVSIERPTFNTWAPDYVESTDTVNVVPAFTMIEPSEKLADGDVLWFAGSASAVGDLRKIPGLTSFETDEVKKIQERVFDRRLVQAVVSRNSPVVGKTVKEIGFRTRYGAAVIAVHRDGGRIHDHPGNIKLHAGDVLLLEAGPTFLARSPENDRSFSLLAEVENSAPPRLRFLIPALILAVTMIIVYTAGVASLLICALVAAILMVMLGIMSEQEARDSISWDVYVAIACAFGIGTALTNSGVAGGVAEFLVTIGEAIGIGDAGIFGAVYLATFLISNVVTNNAAAALIFPIAIDAAEQGGLNLKLMCFCVMLGASASFMSPFGYQTNLMILGPGGYTTKDFIRMGSPMQIVLWIVSVAVLSATSFPSYLSWIIGLLILIVVTAVRLTNGTVFHTLVVKCSCRTSQEHKEY